MDCHRSDLDVAGTRLLLFSRAGFTAPLRRREGRDVVLVDLDRLYRGD